jgi:hypothetical protein
MCSSTEYRGHTGKGAYEFHILRDAGLFYIDLLIYTLIYNQLYTIQVILTPWAI